MAGNEASEFATKGLARLAEDYEDEQVELDTRGKIRKCEEKTGEGGILKKACSILKKPSTKRAEFDSFVESLELPATQDSCAESTSCPETPSKIQGSRRDFAGAKSKEDLERSDKDLKRHCDEEDEGEEGAGKGSRQGEEGEEGEEGQEDQHERYGFDTERPGQVVLDALQEDGADGCENQKWEAAFPDQLPPGLEKQQPGGRQAHESPAEWKVAGRGVGAKGQDAFEDAGEVIHIPDLDLGKGRADSRLGTGAPCTPNFTTQSSPPKPARSSGPARSRRPLGTWRKRDGRPSRRRGGDDVSPLARAASHA